MKLRNSAALGLVGALAMACMGCTQVQSADAPPAAIASADWTKFIDGYLEDYFKIDPAHAVYQGRHEFDGQLPDWSKEGLEKHAALLKTAISKAGEFDSAKLSKDQQFERKNLISTAEGELFWLIEAEAPRRNITWYFDEGLDPNVYVARPYADATTRMKAFIKFANNVPKAVAQIKANLVTPMPLSHVDYAIPGAKGFADYYVKDAKLAFASVKDQALQDEFDKSAGVARAAMLDLATWLEGQRKTANQDFKLGEAKFARMLLATEGVDTPVAEIRKMGYLDLVRNQDALKVACEKFAVGNTPLGCMAKMNAAKPRGGPVAEARSQLPVLKTFLKDNNIVSIPGTEEAKVEESPPYNRQNSAYIDIPGPYEKGLPSVYYISPPDATWTKEEQDDFIPGRKDLLFTSVHEVWPGHFLNFLHSNRAKSTFGRVFYSYAFAEGWAHYSEEMMWEAGLNKDDPETRIGQISNALLRNCRLISAIDLHTGTMTQEQSKQLFMDECYQDEGNAKQQSARGTYDPAYLNYTMGKLLIRKLRDDWTKGDKSKWKAFHDQFLSYGSPVIPLVRAAMMGGEAKAVF